MNTSLRKKHRSSPSRRSSLIGGSRRPQVTPETKPSASIDIRLRFRFLRVLMAVLFCLLGARLYEIQIFSGAEYAASAAQQRSTQEGLLPRRGEIYIRENIGGGLVKLATNTTLYYVYIDPHPDLTPNKPVVAQVMAPLLYRQEDHELCLSEPDFCPSGSVEEVLGAPDARGERPVIRRDFPSFQEALDQYEQNMLDRITPERHEYITVARSVTDEEFTALAELDLPGIIPLEDRRLLGVNPEEIPPQQKPEVTTTLAEFFDLPYEDVATAVEGGYVRYLMLKKKLSPEVTEAIRELQDQARLAHEQSIGTESEIPDYMKGIVLTPESYRYYPDGPLASNVLGFVSREGEGQYGVEGKLDLPLSGVEGVIRQESDVLGRGVVISPEQIQLAEDGVSPVLTIDRNLQSGLQDILARRAELYRADSAQAILMEIPSGKIRALLEYPTFDPNSFGDVYELEELTLVDIPGLYRRQPVFMRDDVGELVEVSQEQAIEDLQSSAEPEEYLVYRNRFGPAAFLNHSVQSPYEPGSTFKPLVMAGALDAAEVTPSTPYYENGPVEIDGFEINTADGIYRGRQTMTNVLETSSNIGMVFVAERLGISLMYDIIANKFRFGDYTDIYLEDEKSGIVFPEKDWYTTRLYTSSFGQGLTATPLQMVQAWGSLANRGELVRPRIVESFVYPDGTVEENPRQVIGRSITEQTAETVTSMLISAVDRGVAEEAAVDGYHIAGKTGTSQIAGSDGFYETGSGAYITSFIGYAPALDPQYVLLVKFDRPKNGREFGAFTAAPTFSEMMTFILDYADVPPSR